MHYGNLSQSWCFYAHAISCLQEDEGKGMSLFCLYSTVCVPGDKTEQNWMNPEGGGRFSDPGATVNSALCSSSRMADPAPTRRPPTPGGVPLALHLSHKLHCAQVIMVPQAPGPPGIPGTLSTAPVLQGRGARCECRSCAVRPVCRGLVYAQK